MLNNRLQVAIILAIALMLTFALGGCRREVQPTPTPPAAEINLPVIEESTSPLASPLASPLSAPGVNTSPVSP